MLKFPDIIGSFCSAFEPITKKPLLTYKSNIPTYLLLAAAAAYFSAACFTLLDKPGWHLDECIKAVVVIEYLHNLEKAGESIDFERLVPPMVCEIEGSTFPAILAVLYFLAGKSLFVLRASHVFFSLGTLFCVYFVCSRWFGKLSGVVTTLLLSISSTFIIATRMGSSYDEIFQIFLFWLALTFLCIYQTTGKKRFIFIVAFVFGIALNTKIEALGYLAGGAAAIAIAGRTEFKSFLRNFSIRYFALSFGFFLLGCSHYLFHFLSNIATSSGWVFRNFTGQGSDSWNNWNLVINFMTRLADLRELASSRLFLFLVENVEGEISNSFTLSFFLVALASIVISLFAGKKEGRSEIKLILVLYAILLMLTCFVPSKHRSEQVLILIPFVEIVIGIFIGLLWKYLGNSLRSALIIALLLGPVVYSEIDIIQAQYKEIKNNRICKVFAPSVFTSLMENLINDYMPWIYDCSDGRLYELESPSKDLETFLIPMFGDLQPHDSHSESLNYSKTNPLPLEKFCGLQPEKESMDSEPAYILIRRNPAFQNTVRSGSIDLPGAENPSMKPVICFPEGESPRIFEIYRMPDCWSPSLTETAASGIFPYE